MSRARPPRTVLHTITTMEAGGAQVLLLDTARLIDSEKYRLLIAFLHGVPMEAAVQSEGIFDLTRDGRFDPLVLFRLARLIRKVRAEIVHTHLVHADVIGRWAARVAGVRTVVTTRHYGIDHKEGSRLYKMSDSAAGAATAVVAISRAVAEHLEQNRIARRNRIAIIPNGVDPTLFDPDRQPQRGKGARGTIGAIGRLHPQKGFLPFLEIFGAVHARFPAVSLEIVGDGPLRPQLEARIGALGLGGVVRLMGTVSRDRMPETIAGWDLVVMPSRWEGFGIAAAEAMAMGRPVVASDLEGLPELIEQAETGFVLPIVAREPWIDAIVGLLEDSGLRDRMGRAGRQRILQHFDVRKMVRSLEALYDRLLGLDEAASRS